MKNLLLAAIILLGCFSKKAIAQAVSLAEAKLVAQHFFAAHAENPLVEMQLLADQKISFQKNQKSQKSGFFIFEPTVGNGFVAISTEKAAGPILGYSTENAFSFDQMPENLNGFLADYSRQIAAIADQKIKANSDQQAAWQKWAGPSAPATENYAPGSFLLRTTWGQRQFYNDLCPTNSMGTRAMTGCDATAMAQIINYWQWSDDAADWFEYEDDDSDVQGDFGAYIGGAYSWGYPDALTGPNLGVAELMFHCGVSVKMNYGTTLSTSKSSYSVAAYEKFFGFTKGVSRKRKDFSTEVWIDMLKQEFHADRPVQYSGFAGDGSVGHTWVCDGYDSNNRFHMNWGWSGLANGFWGLDNLMPAGTNLTQDHQAIFELQPAGCAASYFSTGFEFESYERRLWIEANSIILPSLPVIFDAGQDITFLPGFWAQEGCNFSAIIDGCDGNFDAKNEGDDRAEKGESESTAPKADFSMDLTVAPNPFSGFAKLTFEMPEAGEASIQVFNSMGQKMAEPMPRKWLEAGQQTVDLEAVGLPSGSYFVVLQTSEKRVSRAVIALD